ncbi:hypothetical protein BKM03_03175 [Pseudomonas avellanae]|uniref:Uncharacterized protein n=1 Tax=Pseudomonas avellanae TaxID=46257 RepID=A0AAD0DYA7_9PSED|nr:hypothetical protein BKM03_03175 [Pseudomonas avellanae]PHN38505.1 hypothetical protein AO261_22060 [Pseudomonas avellanae]
MTHLFEQNHGGAHCTPSFAWSVKGQGARGKGQGARGKLQASSFKLQAFDLLLLLLVLVLVLVLVACRLKLAALSSQLTEPF